MENFNKMPRNELGGNMSLTDINKLAKKEITSMVKNS
jgi:hypothetical protein